MQQDDIIGVGLSILAPAFQRVGGQHRHRRLNPSSPEYIQIPPDAVFEAAPLRIVCQYQQFHNAFSESCNRQFRFPNLETAESADRLPAKTNFATKKPISG